jgi:hypothetical protein
MKAALAENPNTSENEGGPGKKPNPSLEAIVKSCSLTKLVDVKVSPIRACSRGQ